MEQFIKVLKETFSLGEGVSDVIVMLIFIVACLIAVASIVALVISIYLAIAYVKYNRRQNSLGKTGEEIARNILDNNGLQNIKVSKNGSILFGNSYSHFFRKIRLRRLTWKKTSVTSLAMAAQKSSLAVLDKENDPLMKMRNIMTPFIYFGPIGFIPLVIIGVLIDVFLIKSESFILTMVLTCLGLGFYVLSFIFSIVILKVEKKAQEKSLVLMKEENLATEEELEMCKKLFHLYNIEYVNNMIIALLELIYRVLQIVGYIQGSGSTSTSD